MRLRYLVVLLATGLVLAMALAATAGAASTERFTFSFSGSEPHFQQCDGFEISLDTTSSGSVIVFFDETGEPIKFIVQSRGADTLTNSVSGKTVVNRFVFEELFTRIDGTDEFTHALVGFRFMGTAPGEGLFIQDVGRIVYSPEEEQILFLAGQHEAEDSDVGAAFCAALS
jgi:hypothetical protein